MLDADDNDLVYMNSGYSADVSYSYFRKYKYQFPYMYVRSIACRWADLTWAMWSSGSRSLESFRLITSARLACWSTSDSAAVVIVFGLRFTFTMHDGGGGVDVGVRVIHGLVSVHELV